jgi:Arc/MetJ-type ribon-helix-helix transcriptional regulator
MLHAMTIRIAVRLPDELVRQLDSLVPGTHGSRSDLDRRSIELSLDRLASEQDDERYERRPLTDDELALADDTKAWSSTTAW